MMKINNFTLVAFYLIFLASVSIVLKDFESYEGLQITSVFLKTPYREFNFDLLIFGKNHIFHSQRVILGF